MIVIAAASSQLGRIVLEKLIERGVSAATIRAVARTPDKLADFAARGVEVVAGDYTKPDTLAVGFAGADRLLLISSVAPTEGRILQHSNAVTAAVDARVGQIVFTSIAQAPTSTLEVAVSYRDTEQAIRASGLPYVFLRNNWYFENATATLGDALERGTLVGAAGEGRIAYATRADFAKAAAIVLTADGHTGRAYELTGDHAYTQAELAAEVSRQTGMELGYVSLPEAEFRAILDGLGLPPFLAAAIADGDARIAEGAMAATTDDLSTLLGRPTTSLADAVAQALK